MAEIIKPSVEKIWSTEGEVAAPPDAKIASGWVFEMMPYEWQNYLQNRTDTFLAYLNQVGIPQWDSTTEYIAGKSYIRGDNGLIYKAATTTTGVNPSSDTTGAWVLAFASASGAGASGTWGISITGNAATATQLLTARTINGTSFNGTANITIDPWIYPSAGNSDPHNIAFAAAAAPGTTGAAYRLKTNAALTYIPSTNTLTVANLAGNASSATKLATARALSVDLSSGTAVNFDGTAAASIGVTGTLPIGRGGTGNTTGNAATATKLATARTINGVSFDGTANITVPATSGGSFTVSQNVGTGAGISLYSGYDGVSLPQYGFSFAKPTTFGTYGLVNSDWATYFTMHSNAGRGWIFKSWDGVTSTGGNVLSISNKGVITTGAAVNSTALTSIISNGSPLVVPDISVPPSGSNYISLLKGSSVLSTDGFRQHISIGGYRSGSTWANSGWYLGLGTNDTQITEAYIFKTGGEISTTVGNLTLKGKADTAVKLAEPVTINGVSFDGSANITVADSTKLPLAGGTLTGAVTFPTISGNWIKAWSAGGSPISIAQSTNAGAYAPALSTRTAGGNGFTMGVLGEHFQLGYATSSNISSQTNIALQIMQASSTTVTFGLPLIAPTPAVGTANTTVATTEFVDRLRSLGESGIAETLDITDRGALRVLTAAGITVPASVFSKGDIVTVINNSSSPQTITQGVGIVLRKVASADTGNRTLAAYGMATIIFADGTTAYISGGGLT